MAFDVVLERVSKCPFPNSCQKCDPKAIFKTLPKLVCQCLFQIVCRKSLKKVENEWLVRDTSKKIRAVKRSKGMSGKPVTSKPVYGYLIDEDENFIIDEEAAPW